MHAHHINFLYFFMGAENLRRLYYLYGREKDRQSDFLIIFFFKKVAFSHNA